MIYKFLMWSRTINLPTKTQYCTLVRPESGYTVFINAETQNYAVKEDHIIVYDGLQSLKEKVNQRLNQNLHFKTSLIMMEIMGNNFLNCHFKICLELNVY
jgi:hypothetical protein